MARDKSTKIRKDNRHLMKTETILGWPSLFDVTPEHEELKKFCPHHKTREYFDCQQKDLKKVLDCLCSIHGYSDVDLRLLVARVIGTDVSDATTKILATACMMSHQPDAWDPYSEFWKRFIERLVAGDLCDGQFPKDVDQCKAIFGDAPGLDFYDKHRPFWPAIIKEGEIVYLGVQPLPVKHQTVIRQGNNSSVYLCTLPSGAILSSSGEYCGEKRIARKIVELGPNRSGPPVEWAIREELRRCASVIKVIACIDHGHQTYSLFMHYCQTDLAGLMATHDPGEFAYSPPILLPKVVSLFEGLAEVHTSIGRVHGDISDKNILTLQYSGSDPTAWDLGLTDGECSQLISYDPPRFSFCDRARFNDFGSCTAPELIGHSRPGIHADVWSAGCVLLKIYVWSALGKEVYLQFEDERRNLTGTDLFYVRGNTGQPKQHATVLKYRRMVISHISNDPIEWPRFQMIDGVLDQMLSVDVRQRCNMVYARDRLRGIVRIPHSKATESKEVDNTARTNRSQTLKNNPLPPFPSVTKHVLKPHKSILSESSAGVPSPVRRTRQRPKPTSRTKRGSHFRGYPQRPASSAIARYHKYRSRTGVSTLRSTLQPHSERQLIS